MTAIDRAYLPFLMLGLLHQIQGSLVKNNLGLKVKRGQSVFLQEGDLQFYIPRDKDACKLEVVLNEPITQRVGTLSPQVFDCHFLADEVKYTHNGCPILKEDTVKLRLYRFTETETYSELFSLSVEIMDPDCNVIRFGSQSLEVPEFYGLSNILDGNVVSFHYEHRHNIECTVQMTTLETHLPVHGQLVTGEPDKPEGPRGDEPDSFVPLRRQLDNKARAHCKSDDCLKGLKLLKIIKVPCNDFLMMGIRYHHIDPPSPDIDYIAIRLDLIDTRSRSIIQSEQAWIPVTIKDAMPNQPPKPAFMSMFILEVDQFILTPLSTATLDAEDDETPKQRLVFNITNPPNEGFITHLSDHTKPISSFSWMDLNDMLISYQPPNSSHTQRRNYEVEFEVHDFYFEKSQPVMVHVSIRTAETNAPRVSWNMGLSLLEGQSRPITWDQLQIVDNDNLKAVRIITVDGLQHGRLTVRGGKGFMFTVKDIKDGAVHYHHDDSDTTKDFIVFRITDGLHQTRHKFPINVLPKDDSPPFLITNMVLELSEGQTGLLRGSILQACDMDSSDDYIMFNITRPPQAGEIMKMPGPEITGYPVTRFLQKDLFHSIIYYRHSGSEVFDDSFEVVLSDFHDPPNLSEPQVIVIQIQPVPDQPPQEAPGVTRHLVVNETDVTYLTKQQLHFVDLESPDSELTYTVTTPPFYSTTYGGSDAGRLFLVDSIPKFKKDPNAPMLRLFTQNAVNYMKVAYMPPILDIGPYPQHIQFILSVTNQQDSMTAGICFNITILPVDNLAPEVHVRQLTVDEGGESWVSEEHMRLKDQDSLEDSLHVELKTKPQHGSIYLDGTAMSPGQTFTVRDLKSLKVRYRHDSSETEHDDIKFIATDGINIADFVLHVKVTPVNDEAPMLVPGLKPILACAEGQEVVITIEYICATDPDSDDSTLMYMIARQPYHGVVQRNDIVVDRFIQADITAGLISYRHTGHEIGLQPRHDIVTFVISDGESGLLPSCCSDKATIFSAQTPEIQSSLPVYDLNITVYPVNNQPPSIAVGEVFVVNEGGSASITVTHLRVEDQDSAPEDLKLILVAPPQFGYIENILPSPGFEKSNMGISIASFTYRDVLNGHINYVQSRHQRMEPTTDQIMLHVSDGKQQSSSVLFYIIISPTNDEIPDFLARNITVREGDMKELDPSIISAVDLDVPRDRLMFSIVQQPQHGSIMSVPHGNDVTHYKRGSEIPVEHFTMDDLRSGMTLMYMHDDSESEQDGFIVQLSDGKHQLQKHMQVKVLPVNDEEPQIIRNTGLEMEAGESRLISSAVLSAHDKDTSSSDIVYVFESIPSHGVIQMKVGTDWVSVSAGMNCSQQVLDMNLLRYLHTSNPGAPADDFFVFHLLDGKNRSPAQHFHITVKELEKGDIALFLKPVRSSRGERVVLTTDVLLAVDGTDKPEELLYVITVPPAHGHVEYIKHTGMQIQSFSQLDVAANLVCYVHDNRATSPKETLQFVVSNGISTRNGTLEILVEMTDKVLPTLVHNTGLRVPQGSTITLTPDALFLSDPDSPHTALSYRVVHPPQYGQLLLKGQTLVAASSFTQQNIQDLAVSYRHSGGASQIDRFRFTASDSTERGFLLDGHVQTEPLFFTLQIEALDSSAPQIAVLETLWKVELLKDGRYGIFISSRELKAQDKNSADGDLIYHILRPPYFGYLENYTNGEFVRHRFSQRDLNRRNILYIINSALDSLTDSLEFAVSDALGKSGLSHKLEFSWASVELTRTEYIICESQGSVSLTIQRKGNVQDSSYVTVQVKELTASAGKDFIPASSLIQFDPGMVSRGWRVEMVQDSLEEGDEKFEVTLISPVGAMLKDKSKATIFIKDTNGQCRETRIKAGTSIQGREVEPGPYPQHGSIQVETLPFSQGYIRGDGDITAEAPSTTKKTLRVIGNGKVVQPSEIIRDGSDVIYKYHGMVSMAVEDNADSRTDRKAQVQVTSWGQHHAPALRTKLQQTDRVLQPSGTRPSSKPCTPELSGFLHYNDSSGQMFHCNGVSWRPWTPTNETVKAQKCPRGWTYHNDFCYILSTERKATWSTAVRACRESFNGNLVSVLSKGDMDWLWDFSERKPFWIGLNDRESKGRWEWVGGEPVTYTNWRRSPPKNRKKGTRKCVLVWRKTKWQIRDCKKGKGHRYVCYVKM
ncbi:FRAS1-related extracellular matrix protein 1a isoform X1 [Rhinichthys klamathensis goyatoka]|uniref:FRAS1-related extracellular matrix protein 1a isoform X1 n=1 Tax=Rhinichthys klamathensis goyatoka TaxID=3034132 RepID=UPI0024B5B06B|nr:FRAS1-related extracellular matrix protein 1a isoform X1 [Rhinichthys klamathensis goyatoka]